MIRNAGAAPEVRALLDRVRTDTAKRIMGGLSPDGPPSPILRTAVRGWLGFMDGACLDWVNHRDVERETLHGLLLATLLAACSPPARRRLRRGDLLEVDDEDEGLVRADRAAAPASP